MTRTVARRGAVIMAVVAFALTLGACGGGGSSNAAVSIETLRDAVSNTQAASSSRFTMDVDFDVQGHAATMHGQGVTAGDGKTAQFTFTIPSSSASSSSGTIEERIVDGDVYMNFGDLLGGETDGKHWVKISLDELDQKTGGALGDLTDQAGQNGPQQGLEYLQGLSGDVEKVGDDTVAGQHATRYRASIDYAKVAAKLPHASADVRDRVAKIGTVPADVWIDDDDHIVKMHFAMDGGSFAGSDGTVEMTMEITDFGVPVDVQPPPAEDTVDFSQLGALTA